MKLGTFAICALFVLGRPVVAHADLVLPPEPSSTPAASPPPADPGPEGAAPSDKPPAEPTATPTGDSPADPTSSVQGPPKGGCASCRVGEPDGGSGALPLLVAAAAIALAFKRRR